MEKSPQDKCCLDKYHCDDWNLFKRVPRTYLSSLVKIRSVTAEVLLLWTNAVCYGLDLDTAQPKLACTMKAVVLLFPTNASAICPQGSPDS